MPSSARAAEKGSATSAAAAAKAFNVIEIFSQKSPAKTARKQARHKGCAGLSSSAFLSRSARLALRAQQLTGLLALLGRELAVMVQVGLIEAGECSLLRFRKRDSPVLVGI